MQNQDLIKEIEYLEELKFILEEIINKTYTSLKSNFVSKETALKLNDIIYDIHEEGILIVKELCKLYQDEWL